MTLFLVSVPYFNVLGLLNTFKSLHTIYWNIKIHIYEECCSKNIYHNMYVGCYKVTIIANS